MIPLFLIHGKMCNKVFGPYVVTPLIWTPIYEWYMVTLAVKNGQQRDKCHDEIGLCAQNIDNTLG